MEKTCESCGGEGSIEETRERYLDELTSTQVSFLYEAQFERKKAENGTEEDIEEATSNVSQNLPSNIPSGGGTPSPSGVPSSGVSKPSGSPPAKGSLQKF